MFVVLALLFGLPAAELTSSKFVGSLRPAPATQPQLVVDGGGNRYTAHTVTDIASLENPSPIIVGRLTKVGRDDTVVWEREFRTQSLIGVALGPEGSVFIAGYGADAGFVSRYDSNGNVVWSRRIEGQPSAIASDTSGSVYITGTATDQYTTTAGAFQTTRGEPKCSNRVGNPIYCSHSFVTKVSGAGQVVYATFLGGSMEETATDIAVGADGSVYVVGETMSSDFPTTRGSAQPELGGVVTLGPLKFGDGFVARLDPSGARLIYGTFFGGRSADRLNAVAVDSAGNALTTGYTEEDPAAMPGAKRDAIILRLGPDGRRLDMRHVRTGGFDYGVDAAISADGRHFVSFFRDGAHELNRETLSSIRVARLLTSSPAAIVAEAGGILQIATPGGERRTNVFAVAPGDNYNGSEYLARYDFNSDPRPYVSAIVNAASYAMGRRFGGNPIALSPNEIIAVFGEGFRGPVQVVLGGRSLPILYAGETQINALVPNDVPLGNARIAVHAGGVALGSWTAEVARAVPALFTVGNTAAAINEDGTINSPEHPAAPGTIVQLFATGLGALDENQRLATHYEAYGPGGPGGGMEVVYAGVAPGLPGVQQVNVRISPEVPIRSGFIKLIIGSPPDYEPTQDRIVIHVR